MNIIDITLAISEHLPVYPGDPVTGIRRVSDVSKGDPFTLSALHMSSHAGTHVDAPCHLFADGTPVDELPLEPFIGSAFVIDVSGHAVVDENDLANSGIPDSTERLIIKTRKSDSPWVDNGASISENAARWIVAHGIKLVGIDQLSVDPPGDESLAVHRTLLRHDVIVVEGLDLSGVTSGEYGFICLPMKIQGCDGAPARAVLVKSDDTVPQQFSLMEN